jgi:hypothetical protein
MIIFEANPEFQLGGREFIPLYFFVGQTEGIPF